VHVSVIWVVLIAVCITCVMKNTAHYPLLTAVEALCVIQIDDHRHLILLSFKLLGELYAILVISVTGEKVNIEGYC